MDIGRALTYFTDDERWVEKTAIGTGVLLISTLLSLVLVGFLGYFILFGYMVRLVQNVRDDAQPVLPEWDQWGDDLIRGLKLFVVNFVWALPITLIFFPVLIISFFVAGNTPYDSNYPGGSIASLFLSCASCVSFLFIIAYAVLQPGFTIAYARNETISDGLQVTEIWAWTREHIGNVVIVVILSLIAGLIIMTVGSIVGVILCIIGIAVTLPLSQVVFYYFQSHLYGQLAQHSGSATVSGVVGEMPGPPLAPEAPAATAPEVERELEVEPEMQVEIEAEVEPEPSIEPEPPVEPEPPAEPEPTAEPEPAAEPEPPAEPKPQ